MRQQLFAVVGLASQVVAAEALRGRHGARRALEHVVRELDALGDDLRRLRQLQLRDHGHRLDPRHERLLGSALQALADVLQVAGHPEVGAQHLGELVHLDRVDEVHAEQRERALALLELLRALLGGRFLRGLEQITRVVLRVAGDPATRELAAVAGQRHRHGLEAQPVVQVERRVGQVVAVGLEIDEQRRELLERPEQLRPLLPDRLEAVHLQERQVDRLRD